MQGECRFLAYLCGRAVKTCLLESCHRGNFKYEPRTLSFWSRTDQPNKRPLPPPWAALAAPVSRLACEPVNYIPRKDSGPPSGLSLTVEDK
jgi:hypothetical protein